MLVPVLFGASPKELTLRPRSKSPVDQGKRRASGSPESLSRSPSYDPLKGMPAPPRNRSTSPNAWNLIRLGLSSVVPGPGAMEKVLEDVNLQRQTDNQRLVTFKDLATVSSEDAKFLENQLGGKPSESEVSFEKTSGYRSRSRSAKRSKTRKDSEIRGRSRTARPIDSDSIATTSTPFVPAQAGPSTAPPRSTTPIAFGPADQYGRAKIINTATNVESTTLVTANGQKVLTHARENPNVEIRRADAPGSSDSHTVFHNALNSVLPALDEAGFGDRYRYNKVEVGGTQGVRSEGGVKTGTSFTWLGASSDTRQQTSVVKAPLSGATTSTPFVPAQAGPSTAPPRSTTPIAVGPTDRYGRAKIINTATNVESTTVVTANGQKVLAHARENPNVEIKRGDIPNFPDAHSSFNDALYSVHPALDEAGFGDRYRYNKVEVGGTQGVRSEGGVKTGTSFTWLGASSDTRQQTSVVKAPLSGATTSTPFVPAQAGPSTVAPRAEQAQP